MLSSHSIVSSSSYLNASFCFDSSLLSTPSCRPNKLVFEAVVQLSNRLSNWLAILKRAMREDVRRVWFSWILLQPVTLSGIRAWQWSHSRPSLIDTRSASLSTLSQTAASSWKLAMGNAAVSDVWRTECLKGQSLHLCIYISGIPDTVSTQFVYADGLTFMFSHKC